MAAGNVPDVTVSFPVKQYMEEPKVSRQWKDFKRDKEKTIQIFTLFSGSTLQVTEATKVAGNITVTCKYLGSEASNHCPVTVTINNRKGMTWDDTDKAAALVTSHDPAVRSFTAHAVPDARLRKCQTITERINLTCDADGSCSSSRRESGEAAA